MSANHEQPRQRRRSTQAVEELLGELNLVPYLDVMVNLIVFLMLTTVTVSAQFGLLAFDVPSFSSGGGGTPPDGEKPLELTVWVSEEGFQVVSNKGAPLDPIPRNGPKDDEGYDFKTLRALLVKIAKEFPKTKNATLFAAPKMQYWVVVKTLDTMKEAEPRACQIERRPPDRKEAAVPFDPSGPPACQISNDGKIMQCRKKKDEVVVYSGCLFPEVVLSDRVR